MSGTQNSTPEFATVSEFKTALAKALLTVAKAQVLSMTKAVDISIGLGLPRPVAKPDDNDFVIPEITESVLVDGKPRSAYKASFLAEHDRKELWRVRKVTYSYLRNEVGYRLSEEAVIQVCEATGLPVPATQTTVTVRVKGFPSTVQFTVDGELDDTAKQALTEKFTPLVDDPAGDVVRELYPGAKGLPERVGVDFYPQRMWPVFPEFEEQAEGSSTDA